uniref:hypothetical protein n=1 Tax=Myxococcus sp. AB036A TaxID=2562793 RepID=UPI0018910C67
GPHPLLAPWLARQSPFPPLVAAQRAIDFAGAAHEPASDALLGALAALTGQTSLLFQGLPGRLVAAGFPTIAQHLETFTAHSHEDLARLRERHHQKAQALEMLVRTEQKNPGGGPAWQVWKLIVLRLNALRDRLEQPTKREAALEELAAIKPANLWKQGLEDAGFRGLNPKAEELIPQWIEDYQRNLPVATEVLAELPAGLLSPLGASVLRDELEVLNRRGALGRIAAGYLSRLVDAPTRVHTPEGGASFEEEVREMFRQGLSRPWLRWRFQLAGDADWVQCAGEDILEELAGLCAPRAVAGAYLSKKRLDLAEALVEHLEGPEKDAVGAEVRAAIDDARLELAAMVKSFLLEPIEQALNGGAHDDAALSQQLTELQMRAAGLLRELSRLPYAAADDQFNQLSVETDRALARWHTFNQRRRQDVHDQFMPALDAILKGRRLEEGPILARALEAALAGDLLESRRNLALLSLPSNHPSRNLPPILRTGGATAFASPRAPRIRTVSPVEVGSLSRFARQAWDRMEVPADFRLPSSQSTGLLAPHERQAIQLRSAKMLHAQHGRWRPVLARWALDEGFAQARERGFGRASEYARDATLLLASDPDSEESRWFLDEALTLWLAARLEGSHLARARESLPWDELRNHLRIAFLIRRFVEYRGLDVLASTMLEVAAIGGWALPRLLSTLGENDHHLRGLLLRDVLRVGADHDTRLVARVVVDLLNPWLALEVAEQLEDLFSQWSGSWTQQSLDEWLARLIRSLEEVGVPSELCARIKEPFLPRLFSPNTPSSDTRFSCSLATTLVYLSSAEESPDEGIQLVANVTYRDGVGYAQDLKLAATVEHPTLRLESANKIRELGLLRRGDVKDVVFPLVAAPGSERGGEAAKAQVTLLLYREDSRGQTEQLARRKFQVNVVASYPHQGVATPYVTGKCLNALTIFKGRNKEVDEILGKLRGQHGDNFVLIYGMRRIGKSSLLQRLSFEDRFRKHYEIVHLDLERHLLSGDMPAMLLEKFAYHIREELTHAGARAVEPQLRKAPDCYDGFEKYLRGVAEALGPSKRLLLLFDEFQMLFTSEQKALGFGDLIHTLRHWIQYLPIGFIVAGTPELKKATFGPEQRLFQLGLPVELKALDERAARELIQEPVGKYFHVTGPATNLILDETDRLPNLIQIVCHELFLRMLQRQQTVATHRDVLEVVEAVSRRTAHFSFLLSAVGDDPLRKAVIRALAELGVDDKRGSVEDLLEHLNNHAYNKTVDAAALERCLEWLSEHHLTARWREELRLRPALLARHVLQRQEYAL